MNSRRVFEGFRQNGDHFGYFFDTLGGVGLATVCFIPPPEGILAPSASNKGGLRSLRMWFLCCNDKVSSILLTDLKRASISLRRALQTVDGAELEPHILLTEQKPASIS